MEMKVGDHTIGGCGGGATGPGTGSYIEVYVHFNGEPAHYARYHPLRLAGSLLIIQPQTVPFSIC